MYHGTLTWTKLILKFCYFPVNVPDTLSGKLRYPELEEENWLVKLMFLVDITMHFNELNLRLQGPGKTVIGFLRHGK